MSRIRKAIGVAENGMPHEAAAPPPAAIRTECPARSRKLQSAKDEENMHKEWRKSGASVMRGGAILGLRSKETSPVQALMAATDDISDCKTLPFLFSIMSE